MNTEKIAKVDFPEKRAFPWQAYIILVFLYFLGNLAAIPLLQRTKAPIEPVWFWGVATLISAALIALGYAMAIRAGLGAPFLEMQIHKEKLSQWLQRGTAHILLVCVIGFPISLYANLDADPATYPFG